MKRVQTILLGIIFLLCTTTSCSQEATQLHNNRLVVAVSIVPQEAFVRAIAGNRVEIVTMIPPGYSPANYEPTPQQLEKLSQAQIYFSIGVPTEDANIIPKIKALNNKLKIIDLAEEVAKNYSDREFAPGRRDPHIWLSPKRAKILIDSISKQLSELDETNRYSYKRNATNYKIRLDELELEIRELLVDMENRAFMVYHPAFGYFADDYGLTMVALEKEGKEATARELQKSIDLARERGIKVIFYQAEVDSQQSRTLAAEIGGTAEQVNPLALNYIENLRRIAHSFKKAMQ